MKTVIFILLLSNSLFAKAQNWEEWTQQKKTQKKYLLQQIAALQAYIGYVKKGYNVVNNGLTTIREIKSGDFKLHRDFIGSLKHVNPKIGKYEKVADIIIYQVRIVKETKKTMQGIREVGQFTQEEMGYCKNVFDNLLVECLKSMEELFLIITPDKLEMKDDERMKRIDMLYADMQNKYAFSADFANEMGMLSIQRLREKMEINNSSLLNGLSQ